MAVFGYFEDRVRWDGTESERLLFSVLWAGAAVGCVLLARLTGLRLLRAHGLTFLVINLYTFYFFQFVVVSTLGLCFIHLLLGGGSLVTLGIYLERRRREKHDAGSQGR